MSRSSCARLVACIVLVTPFATTSAAPPSADDIMQKVEDYSFGKDGESKVSLVIIPKNGTKRTLQYIALRKEYPDATKFVTFFKAPTDLIGAAFMVWDNKKGADPRWIYLPATKQVRRLVAGDSRQSFFGSDFVYEDVTNRDPDQDTHKMIGAQKVNTWDCWVVESTPKSTKGLEFATYKTWVWKDHSLPVRQELYDGSGKLVRKTEALEIKEIQGIQTPTKVSTVNMKSGSESRIQVDDVKYNVGVDDARFEEAQLSRGAPEKK